MRIRRSCCAIVLAQPAAKRHHDRFHTPGCLEGGRATDAARAGGCPAAAAAAGELSLLWTGTWASCAGCHVIRPCLPPRGLTLDCACFLRRAGTCCRSSQCLRPPVCGTVSAPVPDPFRVLQTCGCNEVGHKNLNDWCTHSRRCMMLQASAWRVTLWRRQAQNLHCLQRKHCV